MKILDIGCGTKKLRGVKEYFPDYNFEGEVIGLDSRQEKDVDVICDLEKENIPFPDNTFDIVCSFGVFQYLSKQAMIKVINEIHRILKKGGIFLFKVPYFSKSRTGSYLIIKSDIFGFFTLDPFMNGSENKEQYSYIILGKKDLFKKIKVKAYFNISYKLLGIQFLANKFKRLYESHFCWRLPARTITYELEKI